MLSNAAITPVVHVADMERARKFYKDTLGLRERERSTGGNLSFGTDGHTLELMLKPEAISKDATVVTFEVDDVKQELKDLESRGARFEEVDVPEAKREGKISTFSDGHGAWFKDSEGNWLCIHDNRKA